MKSTLLVVTLYFIFAEAMAIGGKRVPPELQKSWTQVTNPFKEECIKETGVNRRYAERVFSRSEYPDDEKLKCYIKCISIHMKILNGSTGKWVKEEVLRQVAGVTCEIFKNCNDETKSEPNLCQNSFDMSKCFVRGVSVKK